MNVQRHFRPCFIRIHPQHIIVVNVTSFHSNRFFLQSKNPDKASGFLYLCPVDVILIYCVIMFCDVQSMLVITELMIVLHKHKMTGWQISCDVLMSPVNTIYRLTTDVLGIVDIQLF